MSNIPEGVPAAERSFPTHGFNLAGGMTENGVLTISLAFVYSPEWKDGMPAGEDQTTPWFSIPLEVFDEMIEGLVEIREQMRGPNN